MNELTDDHKALLITFALAALESVRQDEAPRSKRWFKMDKAISHLVYLTNTYRVVEWPACNIRKAEMLLDELNKRIVEVFGDGQ